MGRLINKIALVTGSSVGIGKAIAKTFANEGAEVIVVSHNTVKEGEATAKEIVAAGGKAFYVQADLTTQSGVDKLFAEISKHYSKIDILVNNVGHAFSTPFETLSEETILRDIKSNLVATVLCSTKVKEFMPDGGHIINTTSIRGTDYAGRTHLIGYCAGKAAVNSFTKNLALQYAPKIYVNAVAPGFVWTEALSKSGDDLIKKWLNTIPIERFITPEELAEIYVMLATSKIFTGSIITADGGYTLLEKN
ncbi:MAG: SDR family oxidoreductase [Ruminococcus sp.]|nr:SDR family oxidoreductase [Ruminococcus sp.]